MSVVIISAVALLGFGPVGRAVASPARLPVVQHGVPRAERVDLAGLATIELPPGFEAVGRGQSGPRLGHFDPATLDQHRNAYQITFRFEQRRHALASDALADPVLLHVTLFAPGKPRPDATRITFTTIPQFYPPAGADRARLDAHFAAQRWLPNVVTGDAVTRAAATNEGRGDAAASGPPERWLVVHVDPTRRIRIDLYAWRTAYSLDEARALVRRAAESVQATPKLAALLDGVEHAPPRDEAGHEPVVSAALAALSPCGIRSMGPGMVAWSDRCASWLSEDRRFLRVARSVGRIPLAASRAGSATSSELGVTLPTGRSPVLSEASDFRLARLVRDDATNRWSIAGFGERLHDDDVLDAPLISALLPHLLGRASVHVVALASYDLELRPGRVTIPEFIAESDRVAAALRAGSVVAGVRAERDVWR